MLSVALCHLIADNWVIARAETRRELQSERRCVNLVNLNRHNLLQLSNPLLHLHRLRSLIAETLNERLRVGNLLLLVLVGTNLLLPALCTQLHILVVLHLVVNHLAA